MVKIVKEYQEMIRIDVDADTSDYLVNQLMKQKYKDEYAYTFAANGELAKKFVDIIKSNR